MKVKLESLIYRHAVFAVVLEWQAVPCAGICRWRQKENPTWLHQGSRQTGCTSTTYCIGAIPA